MAVLRGCRIQMTSLSKRSRAKQSTSAHELLAKPMLRLPMKRCERCGPWLRAQVGLCVFTQVPCAGCAVLPDYADARRPLGWRLRRTHVPAPRYAVCVSRCPATSPSQAGCASTGLVIATYISNAALSKAQKAAMVTYLRNHQQAVRAFSPPTLCMRAPFLTRWGVVAGRRVGHPHRVPVHYVRHCDELRVHPASRRTLH